MFCWLTWNWIISGPQCTWPPSWCLCTCWWYPHAATNTPDVADLVNIVGQIAEKKGLQLCYSIVITGRKDSLATPTLACLEDSVKYLGVWWSSVAPVRTCRSLFMIKFYSACGTFFMHRQLGTIQEPFWILCHAFSNVLALKYIGCHWLFSKLLFLNKVCLVKRVQAL